MANQGLPSAGYKFNALEEIKSHSSVLYNERMAILFYLLDMRSIDMNSKHKIQDVFTVRGILRQIYKNIRMLIRFNPTVRATLNLETKDDGIYITDFAFSVVDKMIEYCENTGKFTIKQVYIIIQELNKIEMLIKDILQYFHYFIRPDFRQKPDIEIATESYKEIADKRTISELQNLIGNSHLVDFEGLGSSRIELQDTIEYDEKVDGVIQDDKPDDKDKLFEVES